MWRLFNFYFGYDYVAWANVADNGIARVHVDGLGRVFYWRYKSMRVADIIVEPKQVIWLTCSPNKYFGSGSDLTAMLEVLAEPVAWMTYDIHGAQMVWTDYEEACVYCDDDEQPIPLYMPSNA